MRTPNCPNNHTCLPMTMPQLRTANPTYVNGCWCDRCGNRITDEMPLFHCNSCNYDICIECAVRPTPQTHYHPNDGYVRSMDRTYAM